MAFNRSGKTLTQHCSSLFPLFLVRVAKQLVLLHDLSPRNEEDQYGGQIHPFSFQSSPLLTNFERLFWQTNSLVEK